MITCRAGHRCEICGAGEDPASGRRLEAHERWAYDVRNRVQLLRRLICLCSQCHLTTHIGFANVTGRVDEAVTHLRDVTGMTRNEVGRHIDTANATWTARSALAWTLDLSMLTDACVTLASPPTAQPRPSGLCARLTGQQRSPSNARRGLLPLSQRPRPRRRLPEDGSAGLVGR